MVAARRRAEGAHFVAEMRACDSTVYARQIANNPFTDRRKGSQLRPAKHSRMVGRKDGGVVSETNIEIGHEIGDDNIELFGLDVHNPVFVVSAGLAVLLVVGTLLFQTEASTLFAGLRNWTTSTFDWFFLLSANLFVLFNLAIAYSPLGRIRLGGANARPHYRYPGWLAMLFAAGVGIGMMFFGVLEPVTHTLNPPVGISAADVESARAVGMAASITHWGLHAWGIYAVVGLSLAYFSFNRGLPLTLRSAFYPLLGERVWGRFGHLVDVVAVLATLLGLATSIGYGAVQMAGGMDYLFGLQSGTATQLFAIALIVAIALISVLAGLDKGVKRLSGVNMGMAALLWVYVLIVGPTLALLAIIADSFVDYLLHLPALNHWVGREDIAFMHDWTVLYWAWWISWAPFVGMFIARISYGRTIREFITWVLVIPTIIGILWMSVLGGTALEQYFGAGYTGVADAPSELALFKMLELLPLGEAVSMICMLLIAIFLITSADSGALVMDTITAGGKLDSPTRQRVFWCVLAGSVATALMLGGGMASMQALTISIGLPFAIVLLIMCVGLLKGLLEERP